MVNGLRVRFDRIRPYLGIWSIRINKVRELRDRMGFCKLTLDLGHYYHVLLVPDCRILKLYQKIGQAKSI